MSTLRLHVELSVGWKVSECFVVLQKIRWPTHFWSFRVWPERQKKWTPEPQKQLLATQRVYLSNVEFIFEYTVWSYTTVLVFWPKRGIFFRENWFLYSESGRGVLYHWPGQSICIQPSSPGVKTGPITKWQMSTRCFSSPMLVVIREPESHLENRCSAKNSPLVKWNLFL